MLEIALIVLALLCMGLVGTCVWLAMQQRHLAHVAAVGVAHEAGLVPGRPQLVGQGLARRLATEVGEQAVEVHDE